MSAPRPTSARAPALWAAVATALLSLPVLYRMNQLAYDYGVHAELARNLLTGPGLSTPHFLYQLAVLLVAFPLGGNFTLAGLVVVVLAAGACGGLLFRQLRQTGASDGLAAGLTALVLLAAPLFLPALGDGHAYFGYLAVNTYHNPTILLLKPLALLAFPYAVAALAGQQTAPPRQVSLCALLTVAGALAKPSLAICLLPALGLLAGLRLCQRRTIDRRLLLAGFLLPALVVLALQYWLTYSASQLPGVYTGESRIILAPLAVMQNFSAGLFLKFLLSLLFPLAVLTLFFPSARRDTGLLLAWLAFCFGAGYTYLLAESGPRLAQGNFLWSAQITLFLLWARSALLLAGIAQTSDVTQRWRLRVAGGLLLAHALSGLLFYGLECFRPEQFW